MQTTYKGSKYTRKMVAEQLESKFGKEEAAKYDPYTNCMTYNQWLENGFQVKKKEKAIKSITFIEKKDKNGEVIKKYPRTVNLFYIKQVSKI